MMSRAERKLDDERKVTVCSNCLRASCWQGVLMCEHSRQASTLQYPVRTLRRLAKESPSYWRAQ